MKHLLSCEFNLDTACVELLALSRKSHFGRNRNRQFELR